MEIEYIKAFDLNSMWFKVLKACMEKGYKRPVYRGSRKEADRLELDFAVLEVTNPSNRPLVPDVPEGLPPPTSMAYVNKYLAYLITPYKSEWEDYTYGERMAGQIKIDRIEGQRVSALDFNQLDIIQKFLKETPGTNRSIIEVGKPEDLILENPPCMRLLQFKVRYEQLHLFVYFRSWDAWGGLPSNLAALQLLKEHLVGVLSKTGYQFTDGKIFAASMGLHVYSTEWDLARKVVGIK